MRGDIKKLVTGLCIHEFPALVERARVLEKTKMEVEKRQQLRVGGPSASRGSSSPKRAPFLGLLLLLGPRVLLHSYPVPVVTQDSSDL